MARLIGTAGMDALGYHLPAGVAAAAFVCKLPALVRGRRNPLLLSVGGLLLIASAVFFFAAPSTIAAVNELTGVPNFSAPLVYSLLTAFCAACLVLVVNWRGGDPRTIRRATRWCVLAYGSVIAALVTLFVLAEAPEERLRDLDTYYANTPGMREMIVLYLTAHTIAVVATAVLCRRWLREIRGWLKAGVTLLVVGYLLNIVFDSLKFAAVFARWAGRDLDWLSTDVAPPVASLSGVVIGVGFVLPLAGQRASDSWHALRAYRRLEPLWRELRQAVPTRGSVRMPPWTTPELLLTQRRAEIHDRLLLLTPHFDVSVRQRARRAARHRGAGEREASAVAAAAVIVTAVRARSLPRRDGDGCAAAPPGTPAWARTGMPEGPGGGSGFRPGVRDDPVDLVELSGALRHPVVTALRSHAHERESATPHE